jgi:hypothetical protein
MTLYDRVRNEHPNGEAIINQMAKKVGCAKNDPASARMINEQLMVDYPDALAAQSIAEAIRVLSR